MTSDIINIEKLFFQHHKLLCNVANNIVNSRDTAEDIVQDVFFKLWKNRDKMDWTVSMKSYLYKATTNGAINWLEKNNRIVRLDNVAEPITNTENKINSEEIKNHIEGALNNLPPKCKAIFVLNRYEGLKYQEIADHLNISVKTVESQMSIAFKKLREDLKPILIKILTSAFLIITFYT